MQSVNVKLVYLAQSVLSSDEFILLHKKHRRASCKTPSG
jgi:hypothetical protein